MSTFVFMVSASMISIWAFLFLVIVRYRPPSLGAGAGVGLGLATQTQVHAPPMEEFTIHIDWVPSDLSFVAPVPYMLYSLVFSLLALSSVHVCIIHRIGGGFFWAYFLRSDKSSARRHLDQSDIIYSPSLSLYPPLYCSVAFLSPF